MRKLVILICLIMLSSGINADTPKAWFADITKPEWFVPGLGQFVNQPAYKDPMNCLGAPTGGEVYEPVRGNTVGYYVSLGDRDPIQDKGWVKLQFSTPVVDDPRNPYGMDFIVFSNAYFMALWGENPMLYADPTYRWQEPAFVEISQDGETWYLIRPNILPADLNPAPGTEETAPDTGFSSTLLRGYAEYTPSIHLPTADSPDPFSTVHRTAEELYTVPERPSIPEAFNSVRFDYVSGGGDAFDIADAVRRSAPGVPELDADGNEIKANISWFSYIRITDAVANDYVDGLGEISAEIDAVSAVRPAMSIGEAKKLPEGGYALITETIVTSVQPNAFFIESPNRSAAMKVIYDTTVPVDGKWVEVGDKMTITGHVSKSAGRFTLPDPMWTCTQPANELPKPLGIPVRSLSGDLAYGMLVHTWGKMTDKGAGYCTISEGNSTVKAFWNNASYSLKDDASNISITGICDREEGTGTTTIHLADPYNDIKTY